MIGKYHNHSESFNITDMEEHAILRLENIWDYMAIYKLQPMCGYRMANIQLQIAR